MVCKSDLGDVGFFFRAGEGQGGDLAEQAFVKEAALSGVVPDKLQIELRAFPLDRRRFSLVLRGRRRKKECRQAVGGEKTANEDIFPRKAFGERRR